MTQTVSKKEELKKIAGVDATKANK